MVVYYQRIFEKIIPHRFHLAPDRNPPPPLPYGFFPLLQKSSDNPYLKFLDFSKLLVADTPLYFLPPSHLFFGGGEPLWTPVKYCFNLAYLVSHLHA